jgi:hypothetical protein
VKTLLQTNARKIVSGPMFRHWECKAGSDAVSGSLHSIQEEDSAAQRQQLQAVGHGLHANPRNRGVCQEASVFQHVPMFRVHRNSLIAITWQFEKQRVWNTAGATCAVAQLRRSRSLA